GFQWLSYLSLNWNGGWMSHAGRTAGVKINEKWPWRICDPPRKSWDTHAANHGTPMLIEMGVPPLIPH
ncbi:MAG: hypothetical protein OXF82_03220, partial [Gammaproteobacteria bacterium]|nr:hypothetical protein [Gammaproteobacteria bacterium]